MEQEVPQNPGPIVIDNRALNLIKDTMRTRFIYEPSRTELPVLALEALVDYIVQRGGRPGFELRLK